MDTNYIVLGIFVIFLIVQFINGRKPYPESATVKSINSQTEFNSLVINNKEGKAAILVDFYATWCGPCKAIAPVIDGMTSRYPNIGFYKVDVDKEASIARKYDVHAMPTFVVFRNGKPIETIVGADVKKIERTLSEYS